MKHNRGFTLIEILVAVAIFGLLSLAAYTVLDNAMRSQIQAEQRLEHLAQLQRVFYNLGQDLNYFILRQSRNELGDREPVLSGESDLSGQSFSLSFNRSNWRNPARLPRSQLQHLNYYFEEGKLFRKHRIFLDQAPNSTEVVRQLASDIKAVRIEFLGPDKQWRDNWGQYPEQADKLPLAIRVQLTSEKLGELERLFSLPGYLTEPAEGDVNAG